MLCYNVSDAVCTVQALYWSLGAALMEDGREKLDAFVKEYATLPIKTVDDDKLTGPGEIPGTHRPLKFISSSLCSAGSYSFRHLLDSLLVAFWRCSRVQL